MTQIDHIYPGHLTGIVGPSGTIRRLLLNRSFLLKKELDITVFSHNRLYQTWDNTEGYSSFSSTANGRKHQVRQRLDVWARKSLLLSILLMEYRRYTVRKTVDAYLRLYRNPDVVVFHSETEAYYYLKKRHNSTAKTACFFHSDGIPLQMYYLYYPKLKGSFYGKRLEQKFKYVVDHIDRCVYICKIGRVNMNKLLPISATKSSLVINGIDDLTTDQLEKIKEIKANRTDYKIRLITVGSVSIRKGQRLILEALSNLPTEKRERYHLSIVGSGPDMEYCQNYVLSHNLSEIVDFEGVVPNTEVFIHLAEADVFVLMSNNEGLPISIIEAMRAGLAILSTKVSGIPELVENNNGVLVDVSSSSLARVLSSPDSFDWKEMGALSRQFFESQYTFDRMRNDYVSLIKGLVK